MTTIDPTLDPAPSDAISDAITALLVEFSPCDDPGIIADHADNLTHDVLAVIQALVNQRELAIAEAQFEAAGGRDVALAEHIDRLRSHRTLLLRIPIALTVGEREPLPQEIGAALLANLGDDWWTPDEGDSSFAMRDEPTTAEIL